MNSQIQKQDITVCLIAKNEADNLERCLSNIKNIAGDILVLDTGSDDGTREAAEKHGAQVYDYVWDGDFSNARNTLLANVKTEWILWIDGDEHYPIDAVNEILNCINYPGDYSAFLIPRKNYYFGKWLKYGGHYPDYQLKVHRYQKGVKYEKRVHESLQIEGKIGKLNNPMEHYTYNSVNEYLDKFVVYTTLDAQKLHDKGIRISFFNTIVWIFIKPGFRFIRRYIFKAGFLNGFPGLFSAFCDAVGIAVRYLKLKDLEKKITEKR